MTASIDPSNGGWWAPIAVFLTGGTFADKYFHHHQEVKHNRSLRFHSRQEALNAGELTPGQYVIEQTHDNYSLQEVEQQLRAWGGKWNGVSFADSSNFAVVPISEEPGKKISGYELAIRKSQRKPLKFGRRGGATAEGMTLEIETNASEMEAIHSFMPNDNPRRNSCLDQWSPPNPVYDIAANKGEEWERFTIAVPDTPFAETPVGSTIITLIAAGGSLLIFTVVTKIVNNVDWGKFLRRRNRPDNLSGGSSQISEYSASKERNEASYGASKLDEQSDVEQCSVTQALVDPTVKALMESDSMLRVLTAFYEKKVPKAVALSLLKKYHNKTEEEALSLLEGRRPSLFWTP